MIPFSVLDLIPLTDRGVQAAVSESISLLKHAEALGATRYWFAEHHNALGQLSSSPIPWIAYAASQTNRIRVGSGGMCLPNHSPLVLAESFATLALLYPDRIDLGFCRRGGVMHPSTLKALRLNDATMAVEDYERNLYELRRYFRDTVDGVQAFPGRGVEVPLYLLGATPKSAEQAAKLHLPFAFAGHFSPENVANASLAYRLYRPKHADGLHFILALHLCAADTNEEAAFLFTTIQQRYVDIWSESFRLIQPPTEDMSACWSESLSSKIMTRSLNMAVVGDLPTITRQIQRLVDAYQPDELMFTSELFSSEARLHALTLAAQACQAVVR